MPRLAQGITLGLLACLTAIVAVVAAGCPAPEGPPAVAPSPDQIIAAAESLIFTSPELAAGDDVGAVLERIAFGNAPVAEELAPIDRPVPAFICGPTMCVCGEGENMPEGSKEKWKCEGMGTACIEKGYVPDFPCKEQNGITYCFCRKPKK